MLGTCNRCGSAHHQVVIHAQRTCSSDRCTSIGVTGADVDTMGPKTTKKAKILYFLLFFGPGTMSKAFSRP